MQGAADSAREAEVARIPSSSKRFRLARWLRGDGIELGALHQPLPISNGARVRYVDRMDADGLRAHYPELGALDLVPISHVGSAEDLGAIENGSLDFVIACHVLEHLEDPTRGLREIYRVLRDGGIFYCALPEPRVTFDRDRCLTSVEHLLDEHARGSANRREHFVDWVDNVERHQDWWAVERPEFEARVERLMKMDYSIHYHVWRPDTFLEYVHALGRRDKLEFEVLAFAPCEPEVDDEFIFLWRKGVAPIPVSPPQDDLAPLSVSDRLAGYQRSDGHSLGRIAVEARRMVSRAREELRAGGPFRLGQVVARWLRRATGV
jgi:SAM-dependent methyltransferase